MNNDPETGVRLIVALYRNFEQAARCGDITMAQYRTLLVLRKGNQRVGRTSREAQARCPGPLCRR